MDQVEVVGGGRGTATEVPATYQAYAFCNNCNEGTQFQIKRGERFETGTENKLCGNCGCKGMWRRGYPPML